MIILAIETSCDETGIAVLDARGSKKNPKFAARANVVASQVKIHAQFGGVVPNFAKREHQKNLVPTLLSALRDSNLLPNSEEDIKRKNFKFPILNSQKLLLAEIFSHERELLKQFIKKVLKMPAPEIDAIAVTIGPGLAPALWTGVNFARALSLIWRKPIIPVNHLAGHIYASALHGEKIQFPALALIVSGGHTELVLTKGFGKYRIIGETRDDAAGEAFDKAARMLGLGYPGGPAIAKLAEKGNLGKIHFPAPMIAAKNYDFSFSGLKTAVLYKIKELKRLNQKTKSDIAASFQHAVVSVLVSKTIRAAKAYDVQLVILGGGVAANDQLRANLAKALKEIKNMRLLLPDIKETTDNALMIAAAAFFEGKKKPAGAELSANPSLRLGNITGSASGLE